MALVPRCRDPFLSPLLPSTHNTTHVLDVLHLVWDHQEKEYNSTEMSAFLFLEETRKKKRRELVEEGKRDPRCC